MLGCLCCLGGFTWFACFGYCGLVVFWCVCLGVCLLTRVAICLFFCFDLWFAIFVC